MGTLTFGSLARLSDYRSKLSSTAKPEQSKAAPISLIRSPIPTGSVDTRTDQALQWSGLRPSSPKNESSVSALFANPNASFHQSKAPSFKTPALDFTYNFASIKGILAYRDVLLARSSEASPTVAQNISEKS